MCLPRKNRLSPKKPGSEITFRSLLQGDGDNTVTLWPVGNRLPDRRLRRLPPETAGRTAVDRDAVRVPLA